jgi:hypothetical protein
VPSPDIIHLDELYQANGGRDYYVTYGPTLDSDCRGSLYAVDGSNITNSNFTSSSGFCHKTNMKLIFSYQNEIVQNEDMMILSRNAHLVHRNRYRISFTFNKSVYLKSRKYSSLGAREDPGKNRSSAFLRLV